MRFRGSTTHLKTDSGCITRICHNRDINQLLLKFRAIPHGDECLIFAGIYLYLNTFVADFGEFGLQLSFSDCPVELGLDLNATTKVNSEVRSLMNYEENQADNDHHSGDYKSAPVFADKIKVCIFK